MSERLIATIRKHASDLGDKFLPHQKEAIKYLYEKTIGTHAEAMASLKEPKKLKYGDGAILAHDTGLGKTSTSLAFLLGLMLDTQLKKCFSKAVVVTLAGAIKHWGGEVKQWKLGQGSKGPLHVRIIGQSVKNKTRLIAAWRKSRTPSVLIISYQTVVNIAKADTVDKGSLVDEEEEIEEEVEEQEDEEEHAGDETDEEQADEKTDWKSLRDLADILVVDEAHHLSNPRNATYQTLDSFKACLRVGLTATPIQNNLIEFYHLAQFFKPGFFGDLSEYKRKYVQPYLAGCVQEASFDQDQEMSEALVELKERASEMMHSKKKSESNLPPLHDYTIHLRLTEAQKEIYRCYKAAVGVHKEPISDQHILHDISTLPALLWSHDDSGTRAGGDTSAVFNRHDRRREAQRIYNSVLGDVDLTSWEAFQISNKFQFMLALARVCTERGEKLIIFTNSLPTLRAIESMLAYDGVNNWIPQTDYALVDGSVNPSRRDTIYMKFNKPNNRLRLLLLSTKACGHAVHLTGANHLILLDVSWNPCHDTQATGRIHRLGQTKPCYIYRLVAYGGMETAMFKRNIDKTKLATRAGEDVQFKNKFSAFEKDLYTFIPDSRIISATRPNFDGEPNNPLAQLLNDDDIARKVAVVTKTGDYFETEKEEEEEKEEGEVTMVETPQSLASVRPSPEIIDLTEEDEEMEEMPTIRALIVELKGDPDFDAFYTMRSMKEPIALKLVLLHRIWLKLMDRVGVVAYKNHFIAHFEQAKRDNTRPKTFFTAMEKMVKDAGEAVELGLAQAYETDEEIGRLKSQLGHLEDFYDLSAMENPDLFTKDED